MVEQGHDAVALKTQKSAFMHLQTHTKRCEPNEITNTIKSMSAKRVIIMHSYHRYIEHVPKSTPYWVMHGGTRYRQNPEHIAAVFGRSQGHIIQTPDLLNLVPNQNETFVPAYVPDTGYQPMPKGVRRFGHFPSNQANKGTAQIKNIFTQEGWAKHLEVDTTPLPWAKNQERIKMCQVYVELFSPNQGGKQYGAFGVTAIEAALMGRPVITQCRNFTDSYGGEEWDYHALALCDYEEDFRMCVNRYGQMGFDQVERAGKLTREATLQAFSAERIARQLIKAMK